MKHLAAQCEIPNIQAVLQGVPFMRVEVLSSKRLTLLHERNCPENSKNEAKLRTPVCRPQKHSMKYRAIPFRDSIAKGVSHPFCFVFMWYRASIAEIPFFLWGGGIAPPLRMLCKGERLRKGGGCRTQLVMLRNQKSRGRKP